MESGCFNQHRSIHFLEEAREVADPSKGVERAHHAPVGNLDREGRGGGYG